MEDQDGKRRGHWTGNFNSLSPLSLLCRRMPIGAVSQKSHRAVVVVVVPAFFFFFFWCLSVHCGRGFVHNLSFPLPLHFFLVCCYARLLGCYHVVFSSYTVVVMWTVCHRLGTPLFFGPLSLSLLPSPPPPPLPSLPCCAGALNFLLRSAHVSPPFFLHCASSFRLAEEAVLDHPVTLKWQTTTKTRNSPFSLSLSLLFSLPSSR
jgi:hypothetical protein